MKAIVAILSAALVALGGGAIHLWRQLDASRHQAADLQMRVDSAAASAHQAAIIAPSPSFPLTEPAAAVPAATPTAVSNAMDESLPAMMRAISASPEMIARGKASKKGQVLILYPDVGKVLGLSPDEVERLYDLLTEQANEEELARLLGSKYAAWQEYTTEAPARRQVKDLAAVLSAAGTPLSDAQRNTLLPAVIAAEKRYSQELVAKPGQPVSGMSRYSPEANQKILDAAVGHLTLAQLESYRHMLERASGRETAQP